MFDEFRSQAATILSDGLKEKGVQSTGGTFSIPVVEEFGDLSSNAAFQLASEFKKSPMEIASEFADKLEPSGFVKEIKAEKGYINFYIDYNSFTKALLEKIEVDFGRGKQKKEKVIVEHTSANPDGPIHIGHLRNAVIGDTLSRILRFAGYPVEVHYYLNDMGKQVAKVVWGRRRFDVKDGKNDLVTADVYIEASRIIEEQGLDNEIVDILSHYEAGEKKAIEEFEKAVNFCLDGIKETLERLGIRHDKFIWESTFVRDGSVKRIIEELAKTKYARKEGKALFLNLDEFEIEKEMYLTRGDGTSLYIARDLAHHSWKMKQGSGINVWGADHKLVSMHLKTGLTLLGLPFPEFIIHEFISLPQGSMSTRKGVFISADNLIDETVKRAYNEVSSRRSNIGVEACKKISEDVGISAVRFNIARIAPEKSMVFKWDEALDFERQGAPFIQYAYARGKKILAKADETGVLSEIPEIGENEKKLIRTISRFPEVVEEAASSRKASIIANYAIETSNAFHSFYMSSRVLGSKEEIFRLSLTNASVIVLENVQEILGIHCLDEM